MSISTALSIALSGLRNNQTETELVSKNVANADTTGYTAKRLVRSDRVEDQSIVGIKAVVQRQVSAEVMKQLYASNSTTNYMEVKADYLSQVDQMLGSTSSGFSLSDLTEAFTEALQTLAASPDSATAQTAAVNAAVDLASGLNQLSDDVQQMRTDIEASIGDGVTQVNTILKNIETYNQRIVAGKAAGIDVSDLEDARDVAVNDLSEWMDVKTYPQASGSIYVASQSGSMLVASKAVSLNFDQHGTLTAESAWSSDDTERSVGTITFASDGSSEVDLIANGTIKSGKLSALIELRDSTLVDLQNQLDDIAAAMSSAMSDVTEAGTAVTSGAQAGYQVDVGSLQSGNTISLTMTNPAGQPLTYTFVRVDDPSALPLDPGVTGDPGDTVVGIDFSGGIASVTAQIQAALGSTVTVSNPFGQTLQIIDAGTGATVKSLAVTYTADSTQDGTLALPLFVDGNGNKLFTNDQDGGSQKTGFAGRITVNTAITSDPTLLTAYASTTESGDPARAQELADRLSSTQFTFGAETGLVSSQGKIAGTIDSFINTITSYWGSQSESATTALDSQTIIQANIESRYSEKSSVNIDEEMARLIQIQSAYAANARVFTVAKEMLDSLMNS